jgi:hypothetical protein
MLNIEVIAKAYGDRPLWRLCLSGNRKLFYLLNPSLKNSSDEERRMGVGFPKSAVFCADRQLFDSLEAAFQAGNRAELEALWAKAKPLAQ